MSRIDTLIKLLNKYDRVQKHVLKSTTLFGNQEQLKLSVAKQKRRMKSVIDHMESALRMLKVELDEYDYRVEQTKQEIILQEKIYNDANNVTPEQDAEDDKIINECRENIQAVLQSTLQNKTRKTFWQETITE